jgi:hypothetical protein
LPGMRPTKAELFGQAVQRALSNLESKGSLAVLDWFANPLTY